MSLRSLLLGLLLGFAAGWAASTLTQGEQAEPRDRSELDPARRGQETQPVPVSLTGAAPRVDATADPTAAPPDLETLQRRLDSAQARGDGKALRDAVDMLCRLGTPEAQRALLALLLDPDVLFPGTVGSRIVPWLLHSEVEGVAEAAKARFEIRRAAGFDLRQAASGWFTLIGAHEGEAALDWARTEGYRHDHYLWMALVRGILSASRPSTLAFARDLARADPSDPSRIPDGLQMASVRQMAFDTWARLDPDEALPALLGEVHRQLAGTAPIGALPTHLGIQVYTNRVPSPDFPGATELIHRLADSDQGLRLAFQVIARLQVRGMPLGVVEDVVARPTQHLEAVGARGGPEGEDELSAVDRSRDLILGAPWAWSDRSLEAVERSIPWERWPADQEVLRVRLLEARTQRRWSGSNRD